MINKSLKNLRVWLYSRLSRDDDIEQNSLSNQKKIIRDFAEENDFVIVGESFDDNISGMTFDRGGIDELTDAVEKGLLDAVIVKDLSRLGRHRTKTSVYIDYLTEKGVRVLSVTENIDTFCEEDDLMIGFKGILNDVYAKDISRKARAGMNQKQKEGLVMIPPLGYFKDKNTGSVVIIEDHAAIVKRIFKLYLEGYGFSAIAKLLNNEGVKSPAYYQKQLIGKRLGYNKPAIGKKYLWDLTGVKRILQNEFYIGTLICHKTYNSRITHVRRDLPPEERYVHEDFVPAIIDKDTFYQVQELINRKKRDNVRAGTNVPCHRYAGLLQCGECGSCFVSKRRKWRDNPEEIEYVCNGYHRYTKANCSPHRIREKILDELVFNEIISMKDQAYRNFSTVDEDIKRWLKSKSTVDKKVKMLSETLAQRKDDQKEILLSIMRDKAHAAVYEEMLEECEQDIARIEQEMYDIKNYSETIKKRKREMKSTIEIIDEIIRNKAVSDANLRILVEKIIISEDDEGLHITINLNADFTSHLKLFDNNGNLLSDNLVKPPIAI